MTSPDVSRGRIRAVLYENGPLGINDLRFALGVRPRMKGSWSTVQGHLHEMQKAGFVDVDAEGRYTVVRSPGSLSERGRMRDEAVKAYLAGKGWTTVRDVAKALGMSKPAVRRAMKSIGADSDGGFPSQWRLVR